MKKALSNAKTPFNVRSAGLTNTNHQPADPNAVALIPELASHKSTFLEQSHCNWADLILIMDKAQQERITRYFPSSRGKVFLMLEETKAGIQDPYRKDIDEFKAVLALIEQGVEYWSNLLHPSQ